MTTNKKGRATQADVLIGQRIRLARSQTGMTQEQLAEGVSITFQQIQKYERGTNRVSAVKLKQFSDIFEKPLAWFYDVIELDGNTDPLTKESMRALRHFNKLNSSSRKIIICNMIALGRAA